MLTSLTLILIGQIQHTPSYIQKKHREAAQETIANLGPYLHKSYGDSILSSLPTDMQQAINKVTWDEETGRPLTKLDRELDNNSKMEKIWTMLT